MVVIFDLDDTLYDEITFVESGFRAVANWITSITKADPNQLLRRMNQILANEGRGKIFNIILEESGILTKKNIKKCVSVYRLHQPEISISKDTENLLKDFKKVYPLYVVTDGNKVVQGNKVKALKIEKHFKKVFVTHRYGLQASKPSLICFEKIKNLEKVDWSEILYIGDNPKKDFINLNNKGANTVRILQGDHKDVVLDKTHEAQYNIKHLEDLRKLIPQMEKK